MADLLPIDASTWTPIRLGRSAYVDRCYRVRLAPLAGGWGFIHCLRGELRVTLVLPDPQYVADLTAHHADPNGEPRKCGPIRGLRVDPSKFTYRRDGWPGQW